MWLEFELTFYEVAVYHVNNYATRILPLQISTATK